jgi:hypothetical protein
MIRFLRGLLGRMRRGLFGATEADIILNLNEKGESEKKGEGEKKGEDKKKGDDLAAGDDPAAVDDPAEFQDLNETSPPKKPQRVLREIEIVSRAPKRTERTTSLSRWLGRIKEYPLPKLTWIIRPEIGREVADAHGLATAIKNKFHYLKFKELLLFPPDEIHNAIIYRVIRLLAGNDKDVDPDYFIMDGKGHWGDELREPKERETRFAAEWIYNNRKKIQENLLRLKSGQKLMGLCSYGSFPSYFLAKRAHKRLGFLFGKKAPHVPGGDPPWDMRGKKFQGLGRMGEGSREPLSPVLYRLTVDQVGRVLSARLYGPDKKDIGPLVENVLALRRTHGFLSFYHIGETEDLPQMDWDIIREIPREKWDADFESLLRSVHVGTEVFKTFKINPRFSYPLKVLNRKSRHALLRWEALGPERRLMRKTALEELTEACLKINRFNKGLKRKDFGSMLEELKLALDGRRNLAVLKGFAAVGFDFKEGLVIHMDPKALEEGDILDETTVFNTGIKSVSLGFPRFTEIARLHLRAKADFEMCFRENLLELKDPKSPETKVNVVYSLLVNLIRHDLIHAL